MFYLPDSDKHGLRYNPFKSCIVPRPIGWITTLKPNGRTNLAPFSQFNLVGFEPGYVLFSANSHPPDDRPKNSTLNAERTGEFVYNMATWDLRKAVVASSQLMDDEIDDLEALGLTHAPSAVVAVPRVAQSPVAFECRHHSTVFLPGLTPGTSHRLVIGRVVGIHIADDALMPDGKLDVARIKPLARLGYMDYACVDNTFTVEPPRGLVSETTLRRMHGGD